MPSGATQRHTSERKVVGGARRAAIDRKAEARRAAVDRIASAIGLKKMGRTIARRLVKHGITTLAALRRPSVIATLPKAAQANAMYGTGKTRAPLAVAEAAANEIKERLEFVREDKKGGARETITYRLATYIVGSVRRQSPTVKDLDILVILPSRSPVEKGILSSMRLRPIPNPKVKIMTVYAKGTRRCGFIVRYGTGRSAHYFHTDLFLATSTEKPFALFHYTGDAIYNVRTRALAKKNGMLLNQYGLFDVKTGEPVSGKIKTEKDIAKAIGVGFRTPVERNSPVWMKKR